MRAGAPWGEPLDPAEEVIDVAGGDADLSAAAAAHPGVVLRFSPAPASDLLRALGIGAGARGLVAPCDVLDLDAGLSAVNAVVLGVAPDRLRAWHRARPVVVEVDGRPVGAGSATSVVVASGQFLRGTDLVPRGHPGDGRAEVQVYALAPGERRPMRRRLAVGDHLPHPRIAQAAGRRVVVRWEEREVPIEVDGRPRGRVTGVEVLVRAGAARVLI